MSSDLALSTNIIRSFDDAERAARAMAASGFFPDSKQAAQAIVKILAGQELGFGPFASMTGVSIIQGKPTIGANLMAAAVKRTGKYNYRLTEMTDTVCEIAFFENGKETGRSRFTIDDAKKANLTGKDNWTKYPRNMLFARALSNGQRWYAPDVFNGALVYTPDELGQTTDEDGNAVIDAQSHEIHADITVDLAHLSGIIDSEGNAYIMLPSNDLSEKSKWVGKLLAKNDLTDEQKAEYQTKLNAIKEILEWRATHAA